MVARRALAQTDLVGFAIHCAQNSALCANGESDLLPSEPGGYSGFKALFGAQQIDPILTGQPASVPMTDLLGHPITDPFGQPGFPGFDGMEAAVSPSYVAAMQEHGVPVTYAYISDAHDNHGVSGNSHIHTARARPATATRRTSSPTSRRRRAPRASRTGSPTARRRAGPPAVTNP